MIKQFLLPVMLLCGIAGYSQDYYKNGTTVSAEGITFRVERDGGIVMLSNIDNKLDSIPNWYYKDGRELQTEAEYQAIFFKPVMNRSIDRAIIETFTEDEILNIGFSKENRILVYYVVVPVSEDLLVDPKGRTAELAFIFTDTPTLLALPPSKFATLEKKLKAYMVWNLGYYAQKLQFLSADGYLNFVKLDYGPREAMPSQPTASKEEQLD